MKSLHERQESESAREIERAAAEQWEANQATSPKVQAPKGAGAALGLLPASAPAKPPVLSSAAQAKSANIATPKSAKAMPKAGAAPTSSFGRGAATPASAKRTPSAKSTPQEAKGTPSAKNTPKSAPRAAPSPSARGAGAGGNAAKGPSKWSSAISPAAAPVSLRSDVSVAPASNHLPTSVAQADAAFAEAAPKDSAALGASANGGGAKAVMSPPRSGAKKIGGGGVGGAMSASSGMARPNSGAKATQQQAGTSAGKASAAASRASPALLRLFGAAPPEEPQPAAARAAAAAVAAARAAPTPAARRANAAPTSAGAAGAKSPSKWGSAISPAAAPVSLQPEGYRSSPTRDTAPPSVAEAKTSSSSSSSSSAESGGAPARKMTAKAASLAGGASTSASQPSKATARASAKATAKATSSSSNNRVNLFGDSEMSPAAAPAAEQATAARSGQGGVATVSDASFSVDDTFAFGFGDDTVLDAVFSPTRHHSGNGEVSAPGATAAEADQGDVDGRSASENATSEDEARRNAAREKLASGFAPPPDYPLLFSFSGAPTGADAFAMLSPQAAAAAAENPPPPASSPAARAQASAWNRAARLALDPPELAGPQWYLQQERLAADALTTARTESQQLRTALENLAQTSKSFQQRVQHSAYGGGGSAGGSQEKSAAKYAAVPQPSPFASHAHWHAENGGFAPERDDEAASTPSQLFASSTDRHPFGHNSSNSFGSSAYYGGSSGSSSRPSLYAPGSAASQYGTDNFADLDAYLNAAFAGGETPNPNGRHRGALDSHYISTPVERLLPQSSSSPYNRSPATTTGVQGVTPPHLRPYALRGGVGDRLREIYATF